MSINKPMPSGEYAVGTGTYSLYGERNIACRIFYPVRKEDADGYHKAKYMSEAVVKTLAKSNMIPLSYAKMEKEGNFMECYENAPHVPGEKFPLIVYSHGAGAYRESNSFLCIDLASHGYVVICIAHPRLCTCVELDNGSIEYLEKGLTGKTYHPFIRGTMEMLKVIKMKGSDEELAFSLLLAQEKYCGFLLEQFELWVDDTKRAVEYAKRELTDFIDFEKGIGATGHSFGGALAYRLCHDDSDFICGVNIDGMVIGDFGKKVLTKPFMQISCEQNAGVVTRVFMNHTSPVYKVLFKDMAHLGFSDLKHAIPMKKMVGKMDADVAYENLFVCHKEFFDAYLKKAKSAPDLPDTDRVITEVLEGANDGQPDE